MVLTSFISSKKKNPTDNEPLDFNIEDFLKMDGDLNGLGLGAVENEESSRSSKASRWFGNTSEPDTKPQQVSKESKPDSSNEDPARSLLEMLQKGSQYQQFEHKKVVTAEELERSSGKRV